MLRRSAFTQSLSASGAAVVLLGFLLGACSPGFSPEGEPGRPPAQPAQASSVKDRLGPLPLPAEGGIPVAFVISRGAEVLDFTGPLEVFAGALTPNGKPAFKPYFVAANLTPVVVGGGMRVVPDYTFATAPAPKVIVIPAMGDAPNEMIDWIRRASKEADVTMSVCTGAFVLAKTGLLDGKPATTHHGGYFRFTGMFPKASQRGTRFVEAGNVASAGGVTSGIDLALRVVERYVGRAQTQALVEILEYQGTGWSGPDVECRVREAPQPSAGHPVCPLCGMDADPKIQSDFQGKTYSFCSLSEKKFFECTPR